MSLSILCSRTRTPRLWDVICGNSCIKSPGCIHLIAFVDFNSSRQKRSVVSGRILFAVFGISGRVLQRKDPAFALKHYKSMRLYLARNLKSWCNFFGPIKPVSLRKLPPSRNAVINRDGGIVSHTAMRYRSRVTTAKWRVGARKCSILSSANFHCYTWER